MFEFIRRLRWKIKFSFTNLLIIFWNFSEHMRTRKKIGKLTFWKALVYMSRENKTFNGGHLRNTGRKSWKWPWKSHEFLNYRSSRHPEKFSCRSRPWISCNVSNVKSNNHRCSSRVMIGLCSHCPSGTPHRLGRLCVASSPQGSSKGVDKRPGRDDVS